MLKSLYVFKSKIRQNLLSLYFTNTEQKYYLRQLARLLGYSAGSIRRELLRFQEDNLFLVTRAGNLVYYSLNKNHPLYSELKSIVSKTVGIEASLQEALGKIEGIKLAFIYGSFASKKYTADSDIDLMVVGNPNSSLLHKKIAGLEQKLKREINPTVYSSGEFNAKKKNKSGFILNLLENPKIILVGGESDL